MTLTHSPAHTTSYPDRFENEETGWVYSVRHDLNAEDPRTYISDEHVAIHAIRVPPQDRIEPAPANVASRAFDRFELERSTENALGMTRRYLTAFHPEVTYQLSLQVINGYSQSDWRELFIAVREGHGTPDAHAETFRQWLFGDVWTVIPDDKPGIHGIYADDPEDALAYFRENFEDDEPVAAEPAEENTPLFALVPVLAPDHDYTYPGIARWNCADGTVVADIRPVSRGVHLYLRRLEERLLSDPEQLAAAIAAATAHLQNQE